MTDRCHIWSSHSSLMSTANRDYGAVGWLGFRGGVISFVVPFNLAALRDLPLASNRRKRDEKERNHETAQPTVEGEESANEASEARGSGRDDGAWKSEVLASKFRSLPILVAWSSTNHHHHHHHRDGIPHRTTTTTTTTTLAFISLYTPTLPTPKTSALPNRYRRYPPQKLPITTTATTAHRPTTATNSSTATGSILCLQLKAIVFVLDSWVHRLVISYSLSVLTCRFTSSYKK
ncbi:hypothetical protein BDD12DRAFT_808072 [Trichophaea hybrida]|nr:hypothetical protein BDD12DRAFT_808072 [Trichophaea hybrida]